MNGTGIRGRKQYHPDLVAHNFIDPRQDQSSLCAWLEMTITIGSNSEIHTNGKPDTTRANFHHTTSGTEIRSLKKTL